MMPFAFLILVTLFVGYANGANDNFKGVAPLYGWFHPDWAEASGSLPEPWHWEYAG